MSLRALPQERHLVELARDVHFPATQDEMVQAALRKGYAQSTVTFLKLFALTDTFENGVDFINQCEELKLLIREGRHAPFELLRSPQG